MDPYGDQFSIDDPFSDNAVVCPGFTLPRSFTRAIHERMDYGTFSVLSIALSPSKSFTHSSHEKRTHGVPANLSFNHSRDPILALFSVASIWGSSRASVLSIIRRNQTRILFMWDSVWAFFGGLIAGYQTEEKLDVAYTVIRPHSALECTFTLPSDYLGDFYSFYFMRQGAFCMRFMDEFTSRSTQLEMPLNGEKNKEGLAC